MRKITLAFLAMFAWPCDTIMAQPAPPEPRPVLTPGLLTRCDVEEGRIDLYDLVLDAHQTINIVVEQRGIDVVVVLKDFDNVELMRMDGFTAGLGMERLIWVSRESGRYLLQVESAVIEDPAGCYEIQYAVSDTEDNIDSQRVTAAKLLEEARRSDISRDEAVRRYDDSLSRWEALGDLSWQAEILNELAVIHRQVKMDDSIRYLEMALERAAGNPVQQTYSHIWLTDLYRRRMRIDLALEHLKKAREFCEGRFGAVRWQATTAAHLGFIHHLFGEYRDAQRYYDEAVEKWSRLGEVSQEARALENRGWIHYYFSRTDAAHEDLGKALSLTGSNNPARRAAILTTLAFVYNAQGKLEQAFEAARESISLREGDSLRSALSKVALGSVYHAAGNRDEALRLLEEARDVLQEEAETRSLARVQQRIGRILQENGEHEQALRRYEEAAQALAASGQVGEHAEALLGMARVFHAQGFPDRSLEKVDAALELVEELRKKPVGLYDKALLFASKQHVFDFKIELLMDLHQRSPGHGHDVLALQTHEQARGRSLIEALNESGVDLSKGVDEELLSEESRLLRKIRIRLYESLESADRAEELRVELESLQRRYELVRDKMRESHPMYASLTEVVPLSVTNIQEEVLDDETLLLEYFVGREHCFLWAVTPRSVNSFKLDITPDQIESVARAVYELLPESGKRKYRMELESQIHLLSDVLLGPVTQLIGNKRLLIVAGGALQYVPFGALARPGGSRAGGLPRRLGSMHEIVSLPSASTLGILREVDRRERQRGRRPAPKTAAILADPVFGPWDDRLRTDGVTIRGGPERGSYNRLVYSLQEANAIRGYLPDATVATGFEANKSLATSAGLVEYRYVHFATHGTFDAERPQLSRLIFSRYDERGEKLEGELTLPEAYRLGLAAELVVLSACQTALGEEIRGEGMIGFTQGFMYSGTPRVLASLWKVQDESTAVLMELFYRHLTNSERTPASALRAAQEEFLAEYPAWNAPYFWAGFVLQGDF